MNRSLTAAGLAALGLALLDPAGAARAQSFAPSWGQPVYLDAWGRPVGGTPLSEVETRAYVGTGRWADGHHERPRVFVPGRAAAHGYSYGPGYGYGRAYGHDWRRHGGYRGPAGRGTERPWPGYRDAGGYDDDRHPSARRGWRADGRRGCDCGDVYLYDR